MARLLACLAFVGCCLAAAATPLKASEPELTCPAQVDEGDVFPVRVAWDRYFASAELTWLGREVILVPTRTADGYEAVALLGLGLRERLEGSSFQLRVMVDDGGQPRLLTATIRRMARDFPVQSLSVDSRYVDISQEDLARHRREKKDMQAALDTITPERMWTCDMIRPVTGGITSPFGLRRIFNDQPRKPHGGVDLDGETGDEVLAAFSGRVLLAAEHFFAGNSVYIDHGHGVVTLYLHLSGILVEPGQEVSAGEVIGLVGATGRVTGSHLHFGMSVLGQSVDPMTAALAVDVLCP